MNENAKRYYFSFIKLFFIILLIIYFIYNSEKSLHAISVEWFLLAFVMASALGYEVIGSSDQVIDNNRGAMGYIREKGKLLLLLLEVVLTLCLLVFFKDSGNGLFLLPVVILDAVAYSKAPLSFHFLAFAGVLLKPENIFLYLIYCLFLLVIYFQNYFIIEKLRKYLEDYEEEEYRLKDSIHTQGTLYKEELQKSSLAFENKMLEEKARLSQALHDKLGHSINGSIYQLEACKVLMEKDPQESKRIIQGVIDNLRTSMDEIRSLLRREKPDRKRMALLQLIGLCEECKDKYGILAEVRIEGDSKEVSEFIWEIIRDNTFEAVTNALKYSKCTELLIEISILHKVVRCSITDNGIGCSTMKEGMGIQGMMSRVRKVNGFIDIKSDNGFRINMLLPLDMNQN